MAKVSARLASYVLLCNILERRIQIKELNYISVALLILNGMHLENKEWFGKPLFPEQPRMEGSLLKQNHNMVTKGYLTFPSCPYQAFCVDVLKFVLNV